MIKRLAVLVSIPVLSGLAYNSFIGEHHFVVEAAYIVTATIYHPERAQCDADFNITADGSKIDIKNPSKHRWIAVSRDMLVQNGGTLRFGDRIRIKGTGSHLDGIHTVKDVMNKRYKKRIDFLVSKNDIRGKWKRVKVEKI